MKALLPVTIVAVLCAGPALAACLAPASNVVVPDGNSATREQMVAAQRAVKTYDAEVKTYAACLQGELDAEIARGGTTLTEADRLALGKRYASQQNAEVDKLQKVADRFNAALKTFRAKNPG